MLYARLGQKPSRSDEESKGLTESQLRETTNNWKFRKFYQRDAVVTDNASVKARLAELPPSETIQPDTTSNPNSQNPKPEPNSSAHQPHTKPKKKRNHAAKIQDHGRPHRPQADVLALNPAGGIRKKVTHWRGNALPQFAAPYWEQQDDNDPPRLVFPTVLGPAEDIKNTTTGSDDGTSRRNRGMEIFVPRKRDLDD